MAKAGRTKILPRVTMPCNINLIWLILQFKLTVTWCRHFYGYLHILQNATFWTPFIVSWNGIILENIWKLNAINSSLSIIEYLGILCSDLMFKTISSYWATFQFLGCDWPLMTGSSSWWFVALLQLFINVLMGTRDLRYREISLSYSLMGSMKTEYFNNLCI